MKRIFPAAQYDALKAAAEKNGGVGSASFFDDTGRGCCGYGLACDAGLLALPPEYVGRISRDTWLYKRSAGGALPFTYVESDAAVHSIRRRTIGFPRRVPFDLWAAELGLVRGDSAPSAEA